jgi:hypothetical protein
MYQIRFLKQSIAIKYWANWRPHKINMRSGNYEDRNSTILGKIIAKCWFVSQFPSEAL